MARKPKTVPAPAPVDPAIERRAIETVAQDLLQCAHRHNDHSRNLRSEMGALGIQDVPSSADVCDVAVAISVSIARGLLTGTITTRQITTRKP